MSQTWHDLNGAGADGLDVCSEELQPG